MQAVALKAVIPEDRRLSIELPRTVACGPAEIVVIVGSQPVRPGKTAGDLLRSPLVGIRKDREDIADSVEYARELRRQGEGSDATYH